MTNLLLLIILALLVSSVILLIILVKKSSKHDISSLTARLEGIALETARTGQAVREEAARSRDEAGKAARSQRQELADVFKGLGDSLLQRIVDLATMQKMQLETFSSQLAAFVHTSSEKLDAARSESSTGARQLREEVVTTLNRISATMVATLKDLAAAEKSQLDSFSEKITFLTQTSGEKLDGMRSESSLSSKQLREEVIRSLQGITETTTSAMRELAQMQKAQLESMASAIGALSASNETKLEQLRGTVEQKLQSMQADNAMRLEQMRQTVDEKLQGTLETRLGESFRQVSERLELVHKGLGEMQVLASGVGDLKKVLTNVKTRGTWGEVQLGVLLEQVLTPDQFAANLATKGGGERVEFAVRLPGQGSAREEAVWLPIDAKFPMEDYQRLVEAQEEADQDRVEAAGRQLEIRVRGCAADISSKYLNPPTTTDFAILFLPVEGLFAEVVRRTGLTEIIQREYRVVIAGPTTLWSVLNSLQMGFRTLAIQKRSSEVWNLLGAVKTEWTKYGDMLESVQKKLSQASETIEKAKTRSRAVGRKLRDVQELPLSEADILLPSTLAEETADETQKTL